MTIKSFSGLVGMTIVDVIVDTATDSDELIFTLADGEQYKLYHERDCCESVYIEDVIGDWLDIIGHPILKAEETTNGNLALNDEQDSFTWTFYHIVTFQGSVTLRWYGTSNGNYSESDDMAHWQADKDAGTVTPTGC